jgi:NAD(P)H dehydrogenase (quinone)
MAQHPRGAKLVTGASGRFGRRVLELLLDAGVGPLVGVTRRSDKIADLARRGVVVHHGDFDDPPSLATAFIGAERLLLVSTSDARVNGPRMRQHRAAIDAAVRAGVRHVVYTSLVYPDPGNPIVFSYQHYETEQALVGAPLDFTILRENLFAEVLLWILPRAITTGQLMAAAGDGGVAWVTREDCARAAAAVLAATTGGRRYRDLTGPEVVTYAELARVASELGDRPVTYAPVTAEELRNTYLAGGMPEDAATMQVSLDVAVAQGRLGFTTNGVRELTGAEPRPVRPYLAEQREAILALVPAQR